MKVARTKAQLKKMQDLTKRGVCIFCPEHIHEDDQPVLFKTTDWMIKENSYPYEGTKLHLLLISRKHVKSVSELSKAAQSDFLAVVDRCERKFKLTSYAVGFRSGDIHHNGGSIEHLHAHLVVGDTDNPKHNPVRFKMSSQP